MTDQMRRGDAAVDDPCDPTGPQAGPGERRDPAGRSASDAAAQADEAAGRRIALWAQRARAGDDEALLRLHRALAPRHATRAWRSRTRLAAVSSGLERCDLEQQAFLVLRDALRTWPGAGDFRAWFARAARWYLQRYARRWQRPVPAPAAVDGAADDAARVVERVHWATLLAQLPPPERAVLCWRFWQDLTFSQIAARYGVPPATAHDRYRSALARLRRLLAASQRP